MKKIIVFVTTLILLVANINILLATNSFAFLDDLRLPSSVYSKVYRLDKFLIDRPEDYISVSSFAYWSGDLVKGYLEFNYYRIHLSLGLSQFLNVDIYSPTGAKEKTTSLGNYFVGFGYSMAEFPIFGAEARIVPAGKAILSYILEPTFGVAGDLLLRLSFSALDYYLSLRNIVSFFSDFSQEVNMLPVSIQNTLIYAFDKFDFVVNINLDTQFIYYTFFSVSSSLGAIWNVNENFSIGVMNEFKYGNYLNLSLHPKLKFIPILLDFSLSYGLIQGLEFGAQVSWLL